MNALRSPLVTKTIAAVDFDGQPEKPHHCPVADARTPPDWWYRPRG